jgi:hypothetical protein
MVTRISAPAPGLRQWTVPRSHARVTPATDHGDDARAGELNNLRLALATFAMQLDVFEMRTNRGSRGNDVALRPPLPGRRHRREDQWWSIRSLGSKPDA